MSVPTPDPNNLLLSGKAPQRLRLAAAQGLIPMPLRDQVELLIHLTADPDRFVATDANKTLDQLPEERLLPLIRDPHCSPEILSFFCFSFGRSQEVLESVCLNNTTPDTVIAELALVAELPILQTILFNQVRLIRFPAILDNIRHNLNADTSIRRRILEIYQEFFQKSGSVVTIASGSAPAPMTSVPEETEAASVPIWIFPEEPPLSTENNPVPLEVKEPFDASAIGIQSPEEEAIFQRIGKLNTSQKIKRALLGSREERHILVRDTNRMVATSVLKSPKISEQEIDAIASMRNISEEILRMIATNRLWIKNYSTVCNLVKNPKTPMATSLHLLSRLMEKEIRFLAKDRSISDAVRKGAQRILQSKGSSHS